MAEKVRSSCGAGQSQELSTADIVTWKIALNLVNFLISNKISGADFQTEPGILRHFMATRF